jgi:transitional endoplasmic reticulum ATPase
MTLQEKEVMQRLAQLGGSRFSEEDIVFEGTKLIVPASMTLKDVRSYIDKKIAADEEQVQVSRTFRYRPWDGAYATWQVFKDVFGALGHKGMQSFWGPEPPQYRTINIGPDETEEVPWGVLSIPLLPDVSFVTSGTDDEELGSLYQMIVGTPRKYRPQVEGIFALIEEYLRNNSIYRGKAFDGKPMPEFLDLSGVDRDKVVYSEEVMIQLEANIWSVMRHSEQLRKTNMPRKRSALLAGPYGTGKTLAGFLTAKVADEFGWTCVYVRPGKDDLEQAMQTAKLYQPAVVFAEDLDAVAEGGDVSKDVAARILDIFDGITAKGTELMVVLTTNHPERIHKAMLRPGRLDAVINIEGLDRAGVEKLVKVSLPPEVLADDIEWDQVAISMEGMLPAYVVEAAGRAFKYALTNEGGSVESMRITTENLIHAASGLKPQLELMEGAKEGGKADPLSIQIREAVKRGVVDTINENAVDGNQSEWIIRREVLAETKKQP